MPNLRFHNRQLLQAGGSENLEVFASRLDLVVQSLAVHSVTKVKIRRDVQCFARGEVARADSVAPAAIADGSANKVYLRIHRVCVQLLDKHGNVDTSVALTSDIKFVALEFRERRKKVRKELIRVNSRAFVGVDALARRLDIFAV